MATTGLREILTEVTDIVRETVSTATFPVQTELGMVLNPSPPTVDVFRLGRDADGFAGFADIAGAYRFRVRARVLTADFDSGYSLLISFADESDEMFIPGAIEVDPTLNGLVTSLLMVTESDDTAYENPDGSAYLGCHWDYICIPARS